MNDEGAVEFVRLREAPFEQSAAKIASLRDSMLPTLVGRLWHTTHPDRFKSILTTGAILPEPDIPDNERYCTGLGKAHYPYVRSLGGVSLFDFDQFDPSDYSDRYPSSTWATFVPYRTDWGCSIWIEIDRERVTGQLIPPSDLLAKWKWDNAYGHNIMPGIEAGHLGPLPQAAFKRALRVSKDGVEDLQVG